MKPLTNIQKLTISALVVALYIVVLYTTQSISFGAYQIRIATALYGLAYLFPFLIIPMGVANLIGNLLLGGLGPLDMIGGFAVGVVTTTLIVMLQRLNCKAYWIILPIILVPALCVSLWLSYLLNIPYIALVINLSIGQTIPAIAGFLLVKALEKRPFFNQLAMQKIQ